MLVAWAILEDGKKALLHLAPGTKEDTVSCREFFHDLKDRGLNDQILGSTDCRRCGSICSALTLNASARGAGLSGKSPRQSFQQK